MAAKPLREGLSPSNGGLDILMSTYMRLGTDLDFEASKFFVKDAGHQWFRPDENDETALDTIIAVLAPELEDHTSRRISGRQGSPREVATGSTQSGSP